MFKMIWLWSNNNRKKSKMMKEKKGLSNSDLVFSFLGPLGYGLMTARVEMRVIDRMFLRAISSTNFIQVTQHYKNVLFARNASALVLTKQNAFDTNRNPIFSTKKKMRGVLCDDIFVIIIQYFQRDSIYGRSNIMFFLFSFTFFPSCCCCYHLG